MFIRIINGIEETIISLLLAAMTLLVFMDVVLRFGFGRGLMWSQELTLHMSAWLVLFGVSYGIKVGSHIGVDVLVKVLPPVPRRIVGGIAVVACLCYCGLFIQGAWIYLSKLRMIGIELEDMAIQKWIAHSILLIGMVMIAIRLLLLLWAIIQGKAEGFSQVDEAQESMHLIDEVKQAQQSGEGSV